MNTTDLINLLRDQLIVTPGMSARQLGKYLHNDPFLIAKVLHENKDLFSQQADGFGWSALKDAKTEKGPAATKVDELRKSQDQQVCDVDEERGSAEPERQHYIWPKNEQPQRYESYDDLEDNEFISERFDRNITNEVLAEKTAFALETGLIPDSHVSVFNTRLADFIYLLKRSKEWSEVEIEEFVAVINEDATHKIRYEESCETVHGIETLRRSGIFDRIPFCYISAERPKEGIGEKRNQSNRSTNKRGPLRAWLDQSSSGVEFPIRIENLAIEPWKIGPPNTLVLVNHDGTLTESGHALLNGKLLGQKKKCNKARDVFCAFLISEKIELQDLDQREMQALLGSSDSDSLRIRQFIEQGIRLKLNENQTKALACLAKRLEVKNFIPEPSIRGKTPDQYVSDFIEYVLQETDAISPSGERTRDYAIVSKRTLNHSKNKATLEDLGDKIGVTRERVRQIENKFLKNLKLQRLSESPIRTILSSWIASITHEALLRMKAEEPETDSSLCGHVERFLDEDWRMLIHLCGALGEFNEAVMYQSAAMNFEGFDCYTPCPLPSRIHRWDKRLSRETVSKDKKARLITGPETTLTDKIAIALCPSVQSRKVLIHETISGFARLHKNTIHAKTLAECIGCFEENPDWILSKQSLWSSLKDRPLFEETRKNLYNNARTTLDMDKCRFRHINRFGWIDLGDLQSTLERNEDQLFPARVNELPILSDVDEALGLPGQTRKRTIYEELKQIGGSGARELMNLYEEVTGRSGGWAFKVTDHPFFTRAHPGVYTCLDETGQIANKKAMRERLTNPISLNHYIQFRQSGWRPNAFPAWDIDQFEAWAHYTSKNVEPSTANQIRALLKQDKENMSNDQEASEDQLSNVLIMKLTCDTCKRPVDTVIPGLESVFRALAFSHRFGFIDSYIVNCCAGAHWHTDRSISWLALFVASGMAKAGSHWRLKHSLHTIRPRTLG